MRTTFAVLTVLCCALMGNVALALDANESSLVDKDALDKPEVNDEGEVAAPKNGTDAPATPATLAATMQPAPWMNERFERMEMAITRLLAAEAKIRELEKEAAKVVVLEGQIADLKTQLADATSRAELIADGSLGRMAEDPVLRTELGRTLQGRLNLTNNLGVQKLIYINGTAWSVRTGESYIYVPVGKVSIQTAIDAVPTFIDMDRWTTEAGQLQASYSVE